MADVTQDGDGHGIPNAGPRHQTLAAGRGADSSVNMFARYARSTAVIVPLE